MTAAAALRAKDDDPIADLPSLPTGHLPLNRVADYVAVIGACADTGAVSAVLLAYRPGETAACGVALVRRMTP